MRWRVVVTRWLMGLTSTKAWSHPGMVSGSTKTLLARVSGNSTTVAMLMMVFGLRATRPSTIPDPREAEGEHDDERHGGEYAEGTASGTKPMASPKPTTTVEPSR
jgi:hypothetical protein